MVIVGVIMGEDIKVEIFSDVNVIVGNIEVVGVDE
jgi:hypothetical protein